MNKRICSSIKTPIIAGGLITDKEDVMAALQPEQLQYHRQSSGMEDVMAAYDETEYLIAYGEQFK